MMNIAHKAPRLSRAAQDKVRQRGINIDHMAQCLSQPDSVQQQRNDRGNIAYKLVLNIDSHSQIHVVIADDMGPKEYMVLSVFYRGKLDNGWKQDNPNRRQDRRVR